MSYEDHLTTTVEAIVDAAIEAQLYNDGWLGSVTEGFTAWRGGDEWRISPPGRPRSSGGQVTRNGEPAEFDDGVKPGPDIFGPWEADVRAVFQNWDGIPDPASFTSPFTTLSEGAWQIAVVTEGQEVTEIGNPGLESLDYLRDKTVQMESLIMSRFSELYAYPLPSVMHGQYEMMALALVTLGAEQQLWTNARRDVTEIADLGLTAMRSARFAGGGSWSAVLKTVGTLATIASVLPTPAKPILAGAGTVLSGLGTLLSGTEQPAAPDIPLGAEDPATCLDHIRSAIQRLNIGIVDEEVDIASAIEKALTTVSERSGAFDLPPPELVGASESEVARQIVHDKSAVRQICTLTLPRIGGYLAAAAGSTDGALTPTAWHRPGLIGSSEYGPYVTWAKLLREAEVRTTDTGFELLQAATHLQAATGEVNQADERAEGDLRRQRNEVREDLDYRPPGSVTYGNESEPLPPYARP